MNEQDHHENLDSESRRKFLKMTGSAALAASAGLSQAALDDAAPDDYHICRGLNSCEGKGKDKSGTMAGDGNCAVVSGGDHGCSGQNDCKNQGACGSGDYPIQYWIGENDCKGLGGCGVPIGNGNTGFICNQLNGAPPTKQSDGHFHYSGYLGKSAWAIARARFESKLQTAGTAYGRPQNTCTSSFGGNTWDGKGTKPALPSDFELYGTPQPAKPKPAKANPK